MYYGNKPNTNFFQFYGFVIENNDYDEIVLHAGFASSDPLAPTKEDLLDNKSNPKKMKLTETTDDRKFSKAMSYLRYVTFCGSEEELKQVFSLYIHGY